MNWGIFWRLLRTAFLLRVPLAVLALLAFLGPYARGSDLLENLLDLSASRWDVYQVSLGAFLLAYAAVTTLNLILHYGDARLGDSGPFPLAQRRPLFTFIAGSLCAVTFMVFVVIRTEATPVWITALVAAAGGITALALVFLSKVLQLALTDSNVTPHPPPFLVFPAYLLPGLEQFLDSVYCWPDEGSIEWKRRFNKLSQWPLEILRGAGEGYLIDVKAPPGQLQLRSGHVFALSLSVFAFLIYVILGLGKRNITAEPATVPALAYVLLFLNVACWVLAGLTFFFDRYRFPLMFVIAGLALFTANAPQSDHFFRVQTGIQRHELLTPGAYLKARANPKIILIATPGGGIQAAAWTVQVLSGLEKELGKPFRDGITAVSSVSGGSLGSLLYAATYKTGDPDGDVAGRARESAIDEVAWGFTQPDFWRVIAPWFGRRWIDRGWALEEKWTAINHLGPRRRTLRERVGMGRGSSSRDHRAYPENDFLLSSMAAGPGMPALLFNSMLVENGKHVVFSNTAYPRVDDPEAMVNFYDLYPSLGKSFDVRAVTAARMSASFPYVAPAARPDLDGAFEPGFHFVDGGYYDNYGIDALVGWLQDALNDKDSPPVGDVLLIQIRHFNPANAAGKSMPGWLYQTYAPLSGLLSMWNAAPVNRDKEELDLFKETFEKGAGGRKLVLSTIYYYGTGNCANAPLSWKLSPREQDCIVNVWNNTKEDPRGNKEEVDKIRTYLNPDSKEGAK
ncbi:MAG TPA: patatin-like phospholipase family protein [Bryobacteraceae bacterium]|jgi:hypothetical protein